MNDDKEEIIEETEEESEEQTVEEPQEEPQEESEEEPQEEPQEESEEEPQEESEEEPQEEPQEEKQDFKPTELTGDYIEEYVRGDNETLSETSVLLSDSIDYSGTLENIQTLLIFQCTLLIALGCIVAWCCGRSK